MALSETTQEQRLETSTHLSEVLKSILPSIDMAALTVETEDLDGILNDMQDNISRMQSIQAITAQSNQSVDFEAAKVKIFEAFVNLIKARKEANQAYLTAKNYNNNIKDLHRALGI